MEGDSPPVDALTALLIDAVMAGDVARVARLLRDGAPVDGRDESGHSALDHALRSGRADVVGPLVAAGADLEQEVGAGHEHRPLAFAALRGFTGIVRMLLDAGAELDRRERWRPTALTAAVMAGRADAAALLLARGADVRRTWRARSILTYAARDGDAAMTALLLAHGAPPTAQALAAAETRSADPALSRERAAGLRETIALLRDALAEAGVPEAVEPWQPGRRAGGLAGPAFGGRGYGRVTGRRRTPPGTADGDRDQ